MVTFKFDRILSLLFLTLCLASTTVLGVTWYVDPVNGDITYDGTSPFHVPGTNIGPTQTIEAVVYMANQYDIIVLMDGVYTGPYNTSPWVMDMIESNHIFVISAYGPENCTLILEEMITFDEPVSLDLETCFSGITFTSGQLLVRTAIEIRNNSDICFENCTFTGFQADPSYSWVPIVSIAWESRATFDNCVFTANNTKTMIYCEHDTAVLIENSLFTENTYDFTDYSSSFRGLITVYGAESVTVRGCTFSENTSNYGFTAISTEEQTNHLFVDQCIIKNNTSDQENCFGIICVGHEDNVTVKNTQIENLRSAQGSSIHSTIAMSANANRILVSDCQFNKNNTGLSIELEGPELFEVEIVNSEFIGNTNPDLGSGGGYGIKTTEYTPALYVSIRNCTVQQNTYGISLGGHGYDGHGEVKNCLVTDNDYMGLEIFSEAQSGEQFANVRNCTIANNGEYGLTARNTVVKNTILRQKTGMPVSIPYSYNLTLNYCNIEGGWTGPGVGNIDVDPLFVDPGYFDHDTQSIVPGTDYHVRSTAGRYDATAGSWVQDQMTTPFSPCVDAGNPADFVGDEPYGSGGRINMGCYGGTWQASKSAVCEGGLDGTGRMAGDINRDCKVDLADFAWLAADWLESTLYETPIN